MNKLLKFTLLEAIKLVSIVIISSFFLSLVLPEVYLVVEELGVLEQNIANAGSNFDENNPLTIAALKDSVQSTNNLEDAINGVGIKFFIYLFLMTILISLISGFEYGDFKNIFKINLLILVAIILILITVSILSFSVLFIFLTLLILVILSTYSVVFITKNIKKKVDTKKLALKHTILLLINCIYLIFSIYLISISIYVIFPLTLLYIFIISYEKIYLLH